MHACRLRILLSSWSRKVYGKGYIHSEWPLLRPIRGGGLACYIIPTPVATLAFHSFKILKVVKAIK